MVGTFAAEGRTRMKKKGPRALARKSLVVRRLRGETSVNEVAGRGRLGGGGEREA